MRATYGVASCIAHDGRRAYVTHPRGSLTMIDVPSMRVLRTIPLNGTPDGVAVVEPSVVLGER